MAPTADNESPAKRLKTTTVESNIRQAKGAANQLEALKLVTSVVADTGDLDKIKQFTPVDATTNPTLVLQAVQDVKYNSLVEKALEAAKACCKDTASSDSEKLVEEACDRLAVTFGAEILKIVPGCVSTEIDANLSFDTDKAIDKARKIIEMYKELGFPKSRILIKMASTWESIKACEKLEQEGITCNMTLLFSFTQAVACAEAGSTLISPFVGRILDWYKKADPKQEEKWASQPSTDPGVQSVTQIWKYYRKHGYKTIVMGASFRSKGEIVSLAGCDKLTIGPKFLDELEKAKGGLSEIPLNPMDDGLLNGVEEKLSLDECKFRWMLNEDHMATEKLSEGIRGFNADLLKLKGIVRKRLGLA